MKFAERSKQMAAFRQIVRRGSPSVTSRFKPTIRTLLYPVREVQPPLGARSSTPGPDPEPSPHILISRRSPLIEADVQRSVLPECASQAGLLAHSQTTLPNKSRAMSAGPQSPVLTFKKVPATSAQPAI